MSITNISSLLVPADKLIKNCSSLFKVKAPASTWIVPADKGQETKLLTYKGDVHAEIDQLIPLIGPQPDRDWETVSYNF